MYSIEIKFLMKIPMHSIPKDPIKIFRSWTGAEQATIYYLKQHDPDYYWPLYFITMYFIRWEMIALYLLLALSDALCRHRQQWIRQWSVAWRHPVINLINVDLSPMKSLSFTVIVILHEILEIPIFKVFLTIVYWNYTHSRQDAFSQIRLRINAFWNNLQFIIMSIYKIGKVIDT